jgi:transposase
MDESTRFRPYEPGQLLLMPPDLNEWLPDDHLAFFIRDVVNTLDLAEIYDSYDGTQGGRPPYDPRMMTGLLLYAYCVGLPSSRQIEKATWEAVPFRVLAADAHPDHDTIAAYRKRHLPALAGLFAQTLRLCRKAGLVKLGQVALDGTKIRANASKHKAMSYERMTEKEAELEAEVERMLKEAEAVDTAEDALYGKGQRGDELPEELKSKQSRLAKIREAKQALEEEAKAKADEKREARKEGSRGRKPKPPKEEPEAKAQRNFTDPDSRIMKEGATKSFEQSYNCQAAVDAEAQVIVATGVTQATNDVQQLVSLVDGVQTNLKRKPKAVLADAGYYSDVNVRRMKKKKIDSYIATARDKHGALRTPTTGRIRKDASLKERMARKLRTKAGRRIYGKRKTTVEPVFGQIKEVRGFRRFLLRGLENVSREWSMICLTHNLLKLFRHGQPVMWG